MAGRWRERVVIGALAALLAGCGGYPSLPIVARSFIVPCPATNYGDVAWSPDGKHIAFLAWDGGGVSASQIYAMNPYGGEVRRLTSLPGDKGLLQWLPDGQAVSYLVTGGRPHLLDADVHVVRLDGTETAINLPITAIIDGAAWSPDGKQLAYGGSVATAQSGPDIYSINLDGSHNTRLTHPPNHDSAAPAWSPDGQRIAFLHSGYVYVMRADGSQQKRLVPGDGLLYWSPDSQRISFYSYGDAGWGIYVVRPDGTDEKLVTTDASGLSGQLLAYSWLPDGKHMAYASASGKGLRVIDINTLAVEILTRFYAYGGSAPSWSPDGSKVVFIGYDQSNSNVAVSEIYVVNRDGSRLVRLTDNPGKYNCFRWPF